MKRISAHDATFILFFGGLLAISSGCKTPHAANETPPGANDEPLQVSDAPNPVCEEVSDEKLQWPNIDTPGPVRVKPAGPIACVDGTVVSFDGLSNIALPYDSMQVMVENAAAARVDRYLVDRALERAGGAVEVEPDELSAARARFRRGFEDDARLTAYVEDKTETSFDAWFERRIRIQKLIEHRTGQAPTATREQARAYYQANAHEFSTPKRYEFVQVMFSLPVDANESQREEAEKRARHFVDAVRQDGADFEALADDVTDLGAQQMNTPLENLAVALAKALTRASPGEIMGPIESDFGFYVLRLETVHPSFDTPFEQVADPLISRLSRRQYKESLEALREELREAANIQMLWGNMEIEVAAHTPHKKRGPKASFSSIYLRANTQPVSISPTFPSSRL